MHRLPSVFAVAALCLIGCGSIKEGDACNTTGFLCLDTTAALECRGGVWVKLPCRGTGGCKRDADTIKCDMSADLAGDNCASTAKGRGLCSTDSTGKPVTLECRDDGKLTQTNMCRSCTVTGDQVVCSP